jgi:glycosyltransferase involved in cell wall biosynthesis
MRIAVVNNFFPPRAGGSAGQADALAKGYAAAGHEVLVITAAYRDAPAVEERDGFRIVRLPSWTLPNTRLKVNFDLQFTLRPSLRRRVRELLDEFRPDVLHQHGQFFDLTWATGLWARRRKVPVLLTVHTRLESPHLLYRTIFRIADAVLVRQLLLRWRPTFVVLEAKMDRYIDTRYHGVASGKEYIRVGVDTRGLTDGGDGKAVRERLGLGDRPVIVSLGHVIPLRARIPLAKALPAILKKFPDLAVVVVGHVYHDEFLKLADKLGVRHAIVNVGAVPRAEIPDYLAAADAEVHDLEGHGLGISTFEAMAARVPVVAVIEEDHFPGIRLIDRQHLYRVPLNDIAALAEAVIEVLSDPEKARKQVADGGQRLVDEYFAMDTMIGRHLEVLTRLVDESVDESKAG